ncbi:DUF2189 domain-containing protein [Variovorax ginsengisoli]|uniref:DUF2189 domain-containing protein n=1 Tax=Variovorax ginsengisoli TaxID=363844 RepID=A0ABT8S8G4_9BURK|nr:DUF2189 domain-containing protein [Variovorax ginsengisoli]MDN8614536.1 DUF2189 domain-containing protein [Variovorax ginsengisoli]MDO1533706.1 DUF2189 domain-containing protein [Variovorax ginsengisoli]
MGHPLDSRSLAPSMAAPAVRRVGAMRPFAWLRLGARDLAFLPGLSLGMGVLVSLAGLALMAATREATYLAPTLLGGFLLVAPFVAMPLYALSRQREQSAAPDSASALRAWSGNAGSIALFGLLLTLAYFVWERLAAITFALFFTEQLRHASNLPAALLLSGQSVTLVVAFVAVGAAVAALVFALGVVSVPLLVDRPVDVITAVLTSLRCCARNPAAIVLWAALIALLTALGFATFMLALVVIFPWLAHASWHAYREMVDA